MTFGSLFAGIGGMDLGLERAGMTCEWQVEIDPYARRVLAKHWPSVRRWDDVRTFPPMANAEPNERDESTIGGSIGTGEEKGRVLEPQRCADSWSVDLICGGFPCQDISYAGKGAGLAGERSGLWYEFARVVRVLRPRFVLVENVSALLTRGWIPFSGRWPRTGMTRSGRAFRLRPLVRRISGIGSSSWPTPLQSDWKGPNLSQSGSALCNSVATAVAYATPSARDWRDGRASEATHAKNSRPLNEQIVAMEASGDTTQPTSLNPAWVEWLQGFPPGWTEV